MLKCDKITQTVLRVIESYMYVTLDEPNETNIELNSNLSDLGIDSTGLVEICFHIEDELHIKFPDLSLLSDVETVRDLINFVKSHVA